MSLWLQILANISICWQWIRRTMNAFRARVLVPNIIHAGHNMILTPAGYWTPAHSSTLISAPQNGMFYDATTHRVSASGSPAAWTRWDWIGAVGVNGANYGDFFAELRVERGQRLTPAQVVALAVHQTGRWPGAKLRVTTRMGEEQEVLAATGEPDPAAPSASSGVGAIYPELNYIR